jgi:hypothetical protein
LGKALLENRADVYAELIINVTANLSTILVSISTLEDEIPVPEQTVQPNTKEIDYIKLTELVDSMIELIEQDVSAAMDKIDDLGDILINTSLAEVYQRIASHLDNFDINSAKAGLIKLAEMSKTR